MAAKKPVFVLTVFDDLTVSTKGMQQGDFEGAAWHPVAYSASLETESGAAVILNSKSTVDIAFPEAAAPTDRTAELIKEIEALFAALFAKPHHDFAMTDEAARADKVKRELRVFAASTSGGKYRGKTIDKLSDILPVHLPLLLERLEGYRLQVEST